MTHTESTKVRPVPFALFLAMITLVPLAGVASLFLDGPAAWTCRVVVLALGVTYLVDRTRAGRDSVTRDVTR